jgi:hypothetical protein
LGCHFPRLRNASIGKCSQKELEILTSSPHLESLLIRSFYDGPINVRWFSRLKLLGIHVRLCSYVSPPERDHPLEHVWIFIYGRLENYRAVMGLLKRLPRISRVTVELSSSISEQGRTRATQALQELNFSSMGMNMRPPVHGDNILVIERLPASVGV